MEHEPQQPIERRHRRLTPEQEAHARRGIEHALDHLSEDEPVITGHTARLIAASIHSGEGSVLEHFASTDRLNPQTGRIEANDAVSSSDHPIWAMALTLYLENLQKPLPDIREVDRPEPRPEVFLRSGATGRADWVSLVGSPATIEERLEALDPAWPGSDVVRLQLDRSDWEIGNTVGFFGFDTRGLGSLRSLVRIAQGVHKYGEGFAAYVSLFGAEGASRYTYQRLHVGTYENLTELVAAFAFSQGLLDANDAPGDDRTRGPTVNVRLIKRSLSERYVWHTGRTGLHLFARDTLGYGDAATTTPTGNTNE